MRRSIIVAVGVVVAWSGCRRSSGSEVEPDRKPALGMRCQARADCPAGATCAFGRCEIPGPCSAERVDGDRTSTVRYEYDRGFETLRHERSGDVVTVRRAAVSEDGREVVARTYVGSESSEPTVVVRELYDGAGRQIQEEHSVPGTAQPTRRRVYHLDQGGSCRQGKTGSVYEDDDKVGRIEMECTGDGWPVSERWYELKDGKEALKYVRTYRYDDQGRYGGIDARDELRRERRSVTVERGPDGLIAAVLTDDDGDGRVDVREVWNTSCWSVEGGRLVRSEP